jgi:hypothetical protein
MSDLSPRFIAPEAASQSQAADIAIVSSPDIVGSMSITRRATGEEFTVLCSALRKYLSPYRAIEVRHPRDRYRAPAVQIIGRHETAICSENGEIDEEEFINDLLSTVPSLRDTMEVTFDAVHTENAIRPHLMVLPAAEDGAKLKEERDGVFKFLGHEALILKQGGRNPDMTQVYVPRWADRDARNLAVAAVERMVPFKATLLQAALSIRQKKYGPIY